MKRKPIIICTLLIAAIGWYISTLQHKLVKQGHLDATAPLSRAVDPVESRSPATVNPLPPPVVVAPAQSLMQSARSARPDAFPEAGKEAEPDSPPSIPASVTVAGQSHDVQPDSIGIYPRQSVNAGSSVAVALTVQPDEAVGVQILDGGVLSDGKSSSSIIGDVHGHVAFTYQVRNEPGDYRVAIHVRGERRFFYFVVSQG